MSTKQQIYNTKLSSTRVVEGLLTEQNEFIFDNTGGPVKANTRYSIYYTDDMKEIYMTGLFSTKKSKIIRRLKNQTTFKQYIDIKKPTRAPYPQSFVPKPTKEDYAFGNIRRYFVQKSNDKTQPVIEVSRKTFKTKNSLYDYIELNWLISGLKNEVGRSNLITTLNANDLFPGISVILFPLQYWKPSVNSKDDIENKLNRLKK
tara:strand:- start:353 stop:961 length:609 start_codon:yes stop_codon:yes gene_type:complete